MDYSINGKLVSFLAADNVILHGFFSESKVRSDKAVLHVHGLEGSFYQSGLVKVLGNKLTRSGFNFFTIELRGSYSILEMKKKVGVKTKRFLAGGSLEKFEDCIYDLEGAIRYLRSIGMKRIFLQGHSTGCQKITYYQRRKTDRRVKGLILIAPADDYNIWKKQLGKNFDKAVEFAQKHYKKDQNSLMPEKYVGGIKSVSRFLSLTDKRFIEGRLFNYNLEKLREFGRIKEPTLAIFGTKEEYAVKPVKEYLGILRRESNSRNFKAVLIKDANHGFKEREMQLGLVIVRWLQGVKKV